MSYILHLNIFFYHIADNEKEIGKFPNFTEISMLLARNNK